LAASQEGLSSVSVWGYTHMYASTHPSAISSEPTGLLCNQFAVKVI
jgi:hypothetical protein